MATPERFVIESLFHVINKDQQDVEFKLNSAQIAVDNIWSRRMLIPKARQEGVSTYFLARSAVRCLGIKNTRAVVISHDAESTERMLGKVKYFLETMKGPKPLIRNNSKNEITFPKTNSMFYIGTAGSRSFGRGDTITDLHCSEVAYWPDPKKIMSGLLQAVPKRTGNISIESTGNGAGNWYHAQCMRAATGQSSFKLAFLPWWDFGEYQIDMQPSEAADFMRSLRVDLKEPELVSAYNLSAQRLAWRRIVLEDDLDGDIYEWNKEYPSCLADCFQSSGGGIFQSVNYIESSQWALSPEDSHLWKLPDHPHPNLHYIIGGDVSAGVGRDSSVAEVFCLETEEQVAEYINNRIEPDIFAHKLADLGRLFNEAYIGCESNNHGILTLKTLTEWDYVASKFMYPLNKVYRTAGNNSRTPKDDVRKVASLGVRTTKISKPFMLGLLRKKLGSTAIIHSPILKNELSTFVEHEDGSMGASTGCFDDTVMASCMVFFVQSRGAISLADSPLTGEEKVEAQNFSFESIIKELTDGRNHNTFPKYLTEYL